MCATKVLQAFFYRLLHVSATLLELRASSTKARKIACRQIGDCLFVFETSGCYSFGTHTSTARSPILSIDHSPKAKQKMLATPLMRV